MTQSLIRGTFGVLVPTPAFFALAHFSYGPGAFFPPATGAGPVVFRVLEGTLEFDAEDIVTKTPAGTDQPRDMPPGQAFTVTVDDQLVVPGGVVHSARTVGPDPARILGLAVFGAQPPQEFPPGINFAPLTLGRIDGLPETPAAATVTRVTVSPGESQDVGGADGPRIVHVESGEIEVRLGEGTANYWHGQGPFAPPLPVPSDPPARLSTADGVLLQPGGVVSIVATTEATVLVAAVTAPTGIDPGQLLRRYFHEVVDGADADRAARYFAEHVHRHDRPADEQGLRGIQACLRATFEEFSSLSTAVEDEIVSDDLVVGRWTRSGVGPNGPARVTGVTIGRVRGQRIVEEWEVQEVAEQLGDLDADPTAARALVSRFVYDAWSGGDLPAVDDIFAEDFVNHTPLPGQRAGRDGIRQFVTRWHTALPDLNVTVDVLVAAGDRAAVRWTLRGTHLGAIFGIPASGRYVTVSGITVFAVRGGHLSEAWQQWAALDFLEQVGEPTA